MPNHSEPDRTPSVAAVDGKRATEGTELNEIAEVKSESSFHLNGCHISRVKLDRLWGLAREGFPSDSCVFIESTRKGKVESKVKSKSIDGLLAAVRMRTIAGNPNYINDLRLSISEKTREVSININLAGGDILDEGVSVSVSGDEEWVRGRSSVLRELLEDTQSSLLTGRGRSRLPLLYSGFLVASGISFPIAGALGQGDSTGVVLLLMVSLSAVLAGGGFFAGSLLDRRKQTQLILLPEAQRPKIESMSLAGLVIGILGVIATIVAILVAHSDAIHPH
jgi:hypothetical protein